MSQEDHDPYNDARRRFEDLELEERATFLVEAGASTLAQGVREVGDFLADGIEDALRKARDRSTAAEGENRPGAAQPETSQQQAPSDP